MLLTALTGSRVLQDGRSSHAEGKVRDSPLWSTTTYICWAIRLDRIDHWMAVRNVEAEAMCPLPGQAELLWSVRCQRRPLSRHWMLFETNHLDSPAPPRLLRNRGTRDRIGIIKNKD